jgi:hypothetical protein
MEAFPPLFEKILSIDVDKHPRKAMGEHSLYVTRWVRRGRGGRGGSVDEEREGGRKEGGGTREKGGVGGNQREEREPEISG